MDKKPTKKVKKTDLSITLIIIIGLLAVVNFFSYQVFYRWDLTQNKVFSISQASKNRASRSGNCPTPFSERTDPTFPAMAAQDDVEGLQKDGGG